MEPALWTRSWAHCSLCWPRGPFPEYCLVWALSSWHEDEWGPETCCLPWFMPIHGASTCILCQKEKVVVEIFYRNEVSLHGDKFLFIHHGSWGEKGLVPFPSSSACPHSLVWWPLLHLPSQHSLFSLWLCLPLLALLRVYGMLCPLF